MKEKVIIITYSHPEAYPPILSAIEELSKRGHKIEIICRNLLKNKWVYPEGTTFYFPNKYIDVFENEKKSKILKFVDFYKFLKIIRRKAKTKNTIFMLNDAIPLFGFFLATIGISKKKNRVWYHNHDTSDISKSRKFSVGWWSAYFEPKLMRKLDIFTLPANERKQYFNLTKFKGLYSFLPNFPLLCKYNEVIKLKKTNTLKILYQGTIGSGHGFEEIILLLGKRINNLVLEMHIIGRVRNEYKKELLSLAKEQNVDAYLHIHEQISYVDLLSFTSNFDIGIAIHRPFCVSYNTAATASNKIFEYAASGLSVILYDSVHYKKYYADKKWAYFTDLSEESLINVLKKASNNLEENSKLAKQDFKKEYNYELFFDKFYKSLF